MILHNAPIVTNKTYAALGDTSSLQQSPRESAFWAGLYAHAAGKAGLTIGAAGKFVYGIKRIILRRLKCLGRAGINTGLAVIAKVFFRYGCRFHRGIGQYGRQPYPGAEFFRDEKAVSSDGSETGCNGGVFVGKNSDQCSLIRGTTCRGQGQGTVSCFVKEIG